MKVLQDILGTLLDTLLQPVLIIVFDVLLGLIVPLLKQIFAGIFYVILATLLGIVDFLQQIFNVLAGVSTVTYTDYKINPETLAITDVSQKKVYLLDYLVGSDVITNAVIMCTIFAVAMSFLFAIYAIIKSISNSVINEREFRPVAKILRSWFRGVINFMVTPLMVIVGVKISILVLVQVNVAITGSMGGNSTTMGTIIFLANGMSAANDLTRTSKSYSTEGKQAALAQYDNDEKKLPGSTAFLTDPDIYDSLRVDYFIGQKDYKNIEQVQDDFYLGDYNFTSAFVCTLFVFYVLTTSLLLFIRIMIEVLVLYVASPFTIAMFPIDDGRMYDEWKSTFFTRMLSGYGMVFSMSLFLTLVPTIMSPKLTLFYQPQEGQSFGYGGIFDKALSEKLKQGTDNMSGIVERIGMTELDYIMKTLFILGGAYSVLMAQHLILDIVSPAVAGGFKQTTSQGVQKINGVAKALYMKMGGGKMKAFIANGFADPQGDNGGGGGGGGGGGQKFSQAANQAMGSGGDAQKQKQEQQQQEQQRIERQRQLQQQQQNGNRGGGF